ncbi:unnamed protein product [Caenorhabditis sp. 36 PRJEB53466]|nr:unnamed protein product [Caenorhabditis sp. 36 PRJEB53466]
MIPEKKPDQKLIIFDMKGVSNVDLSGASTLLKIQQELKSKNIAFQCINANDSVSLFLNGVERGEQLFE